MKSKLFASAAMVALALASAALVACGDDEDDGDATPTTVVNSPVATPGGTELPEPTDTPEGAHTPTAGDTGIQAVDDAIDAALAGDDGALAEQIVLSTEACAVNTGGAGGPPVCAQGEADGTEVQVFPTSTCEGEWNRPDVIPAVVDRFLQGIGEVYAIYNVPAQYYPPGSYSAIFTATEIDGRESVREIVVTDDGISGLSFGCGSTPPEFIAARPLNDPIVAPVG